MRLIDYSWQKGYTCSTVSGKKRVLIVTDGAEEIKKMAENIAAALEGNSILIKDGSNFAGTDLLPADVLFFGCEKPSPPSFGYLEELLQHINLAGRTFGVFSPNSEEAIQYLIRMAKDSDAALNAEPFLAENSGNIKKWTTMVLAGKD